MQAYMFCKSHLLTVVPAAEDLQAHNNVLQLYIQQDWMKGALHSLSCLHRESASVALVTIP